jgi:hypothetical protein
VPDVCGQLRFTVHCRKDEIVARRRRRTIARMPRTQGQRRRFTGAGAVAVTGPA